MNGVGMEARMKKYRQQLSPERAKVWTEKSPKYQQKMRKKVPVVYYLCRNKQLEHPHFMEVPLSSPGALHLRDVIDRLNSLRGSCMASLYSWSCKRSYKNGFVWHDLCEDDLILPVHGNEYVLKGSELFDESNSDCVSPIGNAKMPKSPKQLLEPVSCRSHEEEASSSSSQNGKEARNSQDDELSQGQTTGSSSDVSPESRAGKSGSLGLADASTQTEEHASILKIRKTCTRGVSTEDEAIEEPECSEIEICRTESPQVRENSEICRDDNNTSSPSSSGRKLETLESLIRADVSKMNSFRVTEGDGIRMMPATTTSTRLKASNLLMQLISCGSIPVRNHSNFGLIPSYKAKFSHEKFPSPLFSTSVMLGELDCPTENPKVMGLRLEDREYFSGSIVESKTLKKKEDGDNGPNVLKRSSSFNAERTSKELKSQDTAKASLTKQPQSESMRSPASSDGPRNSMDKIDYSGLVSPVPSNGSSKRIFELKAIKIEERLASGARIIIESKPSCQTATTY